MEGSDSSRKRAEHWVTNDFCNGWDSRKDRMDLAVAARDFP